MDKQRAEEQKTYMNACIHGETQAQRQHFKAVYMQTNVFHSYPCSKVTFRCLFCLEVEVRPGASRGCHALEGPLEDFGKEYETLLFTHGCQFLQQQNNTQSGWSVSRRAGFIPGSILYSILLRELRREHLHIRHADTYMCTGS